MYMGYIYQSNDWPNFFVDEKRTKALNEEVLALKNFLEGILSVFANRKDTEIHALSSSIKSSWAIEGISLSDDDIRSSIVKRIGRLGKEIRTKAYYDGLVNVLFDAVENHSPITLERILSWHEKIIERGVPVKRGRLRGVDVFIVSGEYKNREVIYEAPASELVPSMMNDFITFVNDSSYPSAVLSAVAHYYFVAIHPFEDGNGRMARLIGDYILAKDSLDLPAVYVSFEIKKKQKEYYEVLNNTSLGSLDITPWVVWYLKRLVDAYVSAIDDLQRTFKVDNYFEKVKNAGMNERQILFLNRVLKTDWEGPLTAKKYSMIAKCHPDTANRDLKKLVEAGLIRKEKGGSKNTHYSVLLDFESTYPVHVESVIL